MILIDGVSVGFSGFADQFISGVWKLRRGPTFKFLRPSAFLTGTTFCSKNKSNVLVVVVM